jgi:DNA-binding response OmpR family regulator
MAAGLTHDKRKRVLIVEDEKPMAKALELKLRHSGFAAKVAYNGQEAIDILNKETFDIMVLDLVMPVVDGFGVLEFTHKKGMKMPIIVASNLSQEEDEKRAKSLGAVDYLVKSNTPINDVVKRVTDIIGS